MSLSKTIILITNHHENPDSSAVENLKTSIEDSNNKYDLCRIRLTQFHKGPSWENIESLISELNLNVEKIIKGEIDPEHLVYSGAYSIINHLIDEVDLLVAETMKEISEYEVRNSKVILHGTLTVISFGFIFMLFLLLGGIRFIKNLTRPISTLVEATQKISQGKRNIKVELDSEDEFQILADSFNSMLDTLNMTTVSERYIRNILDSLYGALLVTDDRCNIVSLNRTTSKLLGYNEEELIGQYIMAIFEKDYPDPQGNPESPVELDGISKELQKKSNIITKSGDFIPVYVTCTILKNYEDETEGMVVVGHDFTEEKKQEKNIEKIRKEGVLAINEAQENERLRIAADIHDGLGQMLTGISYTIQELEPGEDSDLALLQKLQMQVNSAILETKNIAQNLTPIMIKDFGLVAAIQNLVDRTNQLNELEVIFNSYDFNNRIDPKLEKGLYRITQEALNNILKHARAKSASIELFRKEDQVVLVVEDDGIGFDLTNDKGKNNSSGIGLMSMRERVYAFDGILTVDTQIKKGTAIIVEIPCINNDCEEID